MSSETVLVLGTLGSVLTTLLIWFWLKDSMLDLMEQLNQHPGTSIFWARYTLLMVLIAPLAVVLVFTPDHVVNTVDGVRRILLPILLAHFVAFALIGRSLYDAATRVSPFVTYGKKD